VAFQNIDGSIVLLILNNRSDEADFKIDWHGREIRSFLPQRSITSYVWKG
jgi:O-glycosyl hydrolase